MRALILFARSPARGPGKTRLHPVLGPERASRLHEAFVWDQVECLRGRAGPGMRVELCLDGPWEGISSEIGAFPVTFQGPGDLGARMERALRRTAEAGAETSLVLGADAPTVPASLLDGAFAALEGGADASLIPAEDGGYVAVGVRGIPAPDLFTGIPWGTARVLEATRGAARRDGLRLSETAPWFDVDRPEDLTRLARSCSADPDRAPRTRKLLEQWGIDGTGPEVV